MQVEHSSRTRCLAAVGTIDITPPLGIYHRMWGAARHDQAQSVHRPLLASILWLKPAAQTEEPGLAIVTLDHCILDSCDIELMQQSIQQATGLPMALIQICLSHTHAAGLMSRTRSDQPGGEWIGPYLDSIVSRLGVLASTLKSQLQECTVTYAIGRCDLAKERDYWDSSQLQYVCGYNPSGFADDTLAVARVEDITGRIVAIVVNYACHPTSLAWDNLAISPDYVGGMREMVESQSGGVCLFLQGASGDLGPKEGFVGDPHVADRNGRKLGYAVLSALEGMAPAGTEYRYAGAVMSGTRIGVWEHQNCSHEQATAESVFDVHRFDIDLPYRHDLPCIDETKKLHQHWKMQEREFAAPAMENKRLQARAMAEQMQRQLWRLESLHPGKCFSLGCSLAKLGQAFWLFVPGEHYQMLQITLRRRFPEFHWNIATISNGWQPGYIPPAQKYGYGIYQEQIAVVSAGCAELIMEAMTRVVQEYFAVASCDPNQVVSRY